MINQITPRKVSSMVVGKILTTLLFLIAFLAYVASGGLNVWNIVSAVRNLTHGEACGPLRRFLIGGIVASAIALLAFGGGIGGIFILIWAILGLRWMSAAEGSCTAVAPHLYGAGRRTLWILWVTIGLWVIWTLSLCVAGVLSRMSTRRRNRPVATV